MDLDLTGEEDEEVASDIKGVRLYIKRGERDFTSGMLGHVKLLSNKTSENQRLRKLTSLSRSIDF